MRRSGIIGSARDPWLTVLCTIGVAQRSQHQLLTLCSERHVPADATGT